MKLRENFLKKIVKNLKEQAEEENQTWNSGCSLISYLLLTSIQKVWPFGVYFDSNQFEVDIKKNILQVIVDLMIHLFCKYSKC